jgi:hypothetical protein
VFLSAFAIVSVTNTALYEIDKVAADWFLTQKQFQTCWKVLFSILGKDSDLQKLEPHHTAHHMISKTSLPRRNDKHDVRIFYTRDKDAKSVFKVVIDFAKNVIIRRLLGKFNEYSPISITPNCMEIPLSPVEEVTLKSYPEINFYGRCSYTARLCRHEIFNQSMMHLI